ncbi:hypothetical protein [Brucella intermedia]|uniref:hypothetical protein n=1 Tax=Brucella intermedia TaxID=94625 RepID=UPI00224971B6|nr:hypothetical protein [Brucella intermedia]
MNERDATYYRKAYGGIEVNFLNGYKPAADEMILPENVYKFSQNSQFSKMDYNVRFLGVTARVVI